MKARLALLGTAALAGSLFLGADARAQGPYVIASVTEGRLDSGATVSAVSVFAAAGQIDYLVYDLNADGSTNNFLGISSGTSNGALISAPATIQISTHCPTTGGTYPIAVIAFDFGSNTWLTGDVIQQTCAPTVR